MPSSGGGSLLAQLAQYYSTGTLLRYGLGTYGVLLGSWLAACLPFCILDWFKLCQGRRLQPRADRYGVRQLAMARQMVLFNWSWLLPAVVFASPILEYIFPASVDSRERGYGAFALGFFAKVALSFLLDDISFYIYHRALHSHRTLYERFHKPHHVFTAPFCWVSHATHPVEMMLQSVGAMAGPILFGFSQREFWAWLALRQLQGVLDHTGYDLGWWAEFPGFGLGGSRIFGGTAFHEEHHRSFNGNYASCLSFLDDIGGTRLKESKQS